MRRLLATRDVTRYIGDMAQVNECLAALLVLPPDKRIDAANALFDSLDAEEEHGWEEAWADELMSRVEGLRKGTRQSVDSETARARVRERLRSLQR